MQTPIGQTLRQYKILSKIGEDFTGILYKALDTEVGRTVALRTLGPKIAANPELRARLEHDALAASALNHPNIARIYEFAKSDDVDFVVMEALEGEPFDDFLRAEPRDWRLVLLYGRQIASALAAAHGAGIVHGPLNPGRIFSHNEQLTIYDFGFGVREAPPESEPDRKALFGKSSAYISPEQIQGNSPDERSDIFSFGALLYHMSTGQPPFYRV